VEDGTLGVKADGDGATIFDEGGASGSSKLSAGDSIICVVELKYRARLGRRKIGGSADTGIRMSKTDFLRDLLNILVMRAIVRQLTVTAVLKLACFDVFTVCRKYIDASILRCNKVTQTSLAEGEILETLNFE
jgi:hypothetical protein